MRRSPADALPVYVVGKQWMWTLQHRNGRREIDELHVPLGQPVRLVMTSQDVIHSFFVPAFRLKQDVVPGRYTSLWFTATQLGEFHLFCSEYCGTDHSRDARPRRRHGAGRVRALARRRAARAGAGAAGLRALSRARLQRLPRRRLDRARAVARRPARHARAPAGRPHVVADENYVRDSILAPDKDVVAGFAPLMPSYAGQLSEEQIEALIAYLRSTGETALTARDERRRRLTTERGDERRATPPAPRHAELPRRRPHAALLADEHRPQAHRHPLRPRHHRLLLHRRRGGDADPARAGDAAGRPRLARRLQQALHRARRDHGLAVPDPVDPLGARQLRRCR